MPATPATACFDGEPVLALGDFSAPQRRHQLACAGRSDHRRMLCGMPGTQAKSAYPPSVAPCATMWRHSSKLPRGIGDFGCDPLFPFLIVTASRPRDLDPWAPLLVWDLITVLDAHRWCVCPAAPALLVDHAGAAAVPADLRSRSSYSKSRHNSRKQYSRLTPALQPFWRQSVTN